MKQSSPSCGRRGFTIIELLVAGALGVLVLGIVLGLVITNRKVYDLDRTRTALNQNLRSALDIIGADVRQAGARLSSGFPAIEVIDGGDADELVLRRSRLPAVLPVCAPVSGNMNAVFINSQGSSGSGGAACTLVDGNNNGWDDRQEAWRNMRCNQDGVPGCQQNDRERMRVYIYDPTSRVGEWFVYTDDDMSQFKIHKSTSPSWSRSYPLGSRLYALEERRYHLNGDIIELVLNGDAASAQSLVDQIVKFDVRVQISDGTWKTSFGPADNWTDIANIQVDLTGSAPLRGRVLQRELRGKFLPRNVLSN